ncbi:MAG: di-trans,poly-cis-decaprenylcistransferase [Alphaproteobacteria bacterium]|nr:di-trans,poly-cis-decaprenylcistransferase [Alphaproteobacteria bacterium]HCP01748.1 isoprenyl transferase [Rhodospirillaceae bacterium]
MSDAADQTGQVPVHIAIIMDGNGRWARARGLPRSAGHSKGADAVKRTLEASEELGVSFLTLFGFSSENWNRPDGEVDDLMGLLRSYLQSETSTLHKRQVRIRVIGDRSRFSDDIVALIESAELMTAANTGLNLTAALSYGGRQDITEAVRALALRAADGDLDPASIDEELVGQHLWTGDMPDPDLLIRTSNEQRISNFLLWQCAYTELVFADVLWPDFGRTQLEQCIAEYNRRDRRFGAVAG